MPDHITREPVMHNDHTGLPMLGIDAQSSNHMEEACRAINRELINVYQKGIWPAGTVPWIHVVQHADGAVRIMVGPTREVMA